MYSVPFTQEAVWRNANAGWTIKDFTEKYNMTEEEFYRNLELLYKKERSNVQSAPQKLRKKIEKNGKKESGKSRQKKQEKPNVEMVDSEVKSKELSSAIVTTQVLTPPVSDFNSKLLEKNFSDAFLSVRKTLDINANFEKDESHENEIQSRKYKFRKTDLTQSMLDKDEPKEEIQSDENSTVEVLSLLESLKKEEKELSDYICELEKERKRLNESHSNFQSELLESNKAINNIINMLKEQKAKVEGVHKKMKKTSELLRENSELLKIANKDLTKIREKIQEQQKVVVYCYKTEAGDGEYVADDVSVKQEEIHSKMLELMSLAEVKDFLTSLALGTVLEIARYAAIYDHVKNDNNEKTIEFYFKKDDSNEDIRKALSIMGISLVIEHMD